MLSLCGFLEAPSFLRKLDCVTLLQSAAYLTSSLSEVMQAYRFAVFNVLAGHHNNHSKNFAFLYDEFKGRYTLAPTYNLTYTSLISEHYLTCFGNGRGLASPSGKNQHPNSQGERGHSKGQRNSPRTAMSMYGSIISFGLKTYNSTASSVRTAARFCIEGRTG